MHSDFLNEDKICEMFNQEHDLAPRKDEVSLNFTVTSRQSKGAIPTIGTYQSKTYAQYQNNHQSQQANRFSPHLKANNSQMSIGGALEQLDKFNDWLNFQNKQNQKLLSEVSTLSSLAENSRSVLLNMPDFGYIRKKCSKSVRVNSTSAGQKNFGQNYYFEAPGACLGCKEKDQLIEIINQQYNAKLDECYAKQIKLKAFQKRKQNEFKQEIRNTLLDGVELNLIKQQNVNLNSQVSGLRMEIEKQKLEKSILMQKSTSLLKTKELERKSDSSCTNFKLFSNAKFSTNAINPNDTMNRVDSIICFGDTEPNLEELIRFYGEQANTFKLKNRQVGNHQDRKGPGGKKLSMSQLKTLNNSEQESFHKLSQLYKQIQLKLMDLKSYKLKNPHIFTSYTKERRGLQEEDFTLSNRQQIQQFKKTIMGLQKKMKGIENQNNNLYETNSDLVSKISELTIKLKECEQVLKRKNEELKFFQDVYMKNKSQIKLLYHKHKLESTQRKKLLQDLENLKGSVRFYCRVRPRIGSEAKLRSTINYGEDNKIIKDNKQYEFNAVFSEKSNQTQIFQQIKGLVQCAYEGKNLCILAYGQTGSGKTYTIHGNQQKHGLAPMIFQQLFSLIEGENKSYETVITMTIVQIYKQQIRDLLGISDNIQVKQDPDRGVYLGQYKPIKVTKMSQLFQLYYKGIEQRDKFEGNIIPDSSRSHCIFSLLIEKTKRKPQNQKQAHQKQTKQVKETTYSKITLVDLAGSEKISNSNPINIKDAQFINKSLTNLGLVLSGVRNTSTNIPYKDTKLTLLLKESLSAHSNIVTFINVIPTQMCSLQTTNSLMFAMRAKSLQKSLMKPRDSKEKEGKQNEKNRRSSTRLSMS